MRTNTGIDITGHGRLPRKPGRPAAHGDAAGEGRICPDGPSLDGSQASRLRRNSQAGAGSNRPSAASPAQKEKEGRARCGRV